MVTTFRVIYKQSALEGKGLIKILCEQCRVATVRSGFFVKTYSR